MTETPTTIVFLLFPGITQLDFTAPAQALCRMPGAALVGAAQNLDPIATDSGFAILPTHDFASAPQADILCVPGTVSGGRISGVPLLRMDGQAVFKLAVGVLEKTARASLEKAGRTEADIDWLIPHQANIRIMQGTAKKLHLPLEKVVVTVHDHGNTSAASIPLALDHGVRMGQVKPGQTLLLEGVGGGFTWNAVLLDL